MKIVAVADTHLFVDSLPEIPNGDVLIHAGDLLRRGNLEELKEGLQWLSSLPHPHKILVAGNHDRCFEKHTSTARMMAQEHGVTYLEDELLILEGLRFWGSPWQPAYNDWAFNLPRGVKLAQKWELIPEDIDILITHSPPKGYGDRSPVPGRDGCAELQKKLQRTKVKLHIFGHIHQDGGLWASQGRIYLNATTWECMRPASVIHYCTQHHRITPITIPPAEEFHF